MPSARAATPSSAVLHACVMLLCGRRDVADHIGLGITARERGCPERRRDCPSSARAPHGLRLELRQPALERSGLEAARMRLEELLDRRLLARAIAECAQRADANVARLFDERSIAAAEILLRVLERVRRL